MAKMKGEKKATYKLQHKEVDKTPIQRTYCALKKAIDLLHGSLYTH